MTPREERGLVIAATSKIRQKGNVWLVPSQSNSHDKYAVSLQESATRRFITTWMLWFAALVLWVLAIVFHGVLVANLQPQPQLFSMWWLLGGFFVALAGMLSAIFRRFRRTNGR